MNHAEIDCIWRGEKTLLRAFDLGDWEVVRDWDLDSENQRQSDRIYFPRSKESHRKWVEKISTNVPENDQFFFAIQNAEGELVGIINTHSCDRRNGTFKYGLGVGHGHRRKGYAKEAIQLVLRYFFDELGYQKITVHVYDFNEASIRLHEAMGFRREGCLRSMIYSDGRFHDDLIFGMTSGEWRERRGKPARALPGKALHPQA